MKYWEHFEKEVGHLMRLQGWDVENEQLIRSIKVDLLAQKTLFVGRKYRVAIECKAHKNPLTKKDVESIYAAYYPLLENKDVDELVIVTIRGVSPAAVSYCKSIGNLTHSTFSELESTILDFSSYTQGIVGEYQRKGIEHYYVQQSLRNNDEYPVLVDDYFGNWVSQSKGEPIAVLGGYGMGKSTMALFLAYNQVLRLRNDPRTRYQY